MFLANLAAEALSSDRVQLRQRLRRLLRPAWLGTLRRTTPLSNSWGFDRGAPIDRYYIESFLQENRHSVRGRVLEVKDSSYTNKFGTNVEQRDVLDVNPSNPEATIIADLSAADAIPSNLFDCFILTQTLQLIYETRAAIAQARRILQPGGVLLVTVPALSRISGGGLQTDYWRFTTASCGLLFQEIFGAGNVSVRSYGNVLAGIAFLAGMACQELTLRELEAHDDYFPLIIAVRAVKAPSSVRPCL